MNLKKFVASLTAAACVGGIVGVMPEVLQDTYAAELVHNDFEVNYDGWYSNDDIARFFAVPGAGVNGSRGMKVTNRTSPEVGAASSKGFYLLGGEKYNYSVQVCSETDEVFHISLLYKDEYTEEETVVEIASKKVKAGEWTEISADYTAPEMSFEFLLTITTETTNDFMIDDVIITGDKNATEMKAKAVAGNGLKDVFKGYGFRVGNIFNSGTIRNSAIQATILKDCNAIECENETKPDATLVSSGSSNTNINVRTNSFASIADFCVNNNLAFRGHTLVWHSQTPQWFFKDNFQDGGSWVNSSTMDQRLESYIKNMFNAYKTQYPALNLYAYDVCNECISDDSNRTANAGGARTPGYGNGASPWVQVYGSNAFIEKAFTYARQYAPQDCKLYYNDYNEYWDHKRDSIINTILKPLSQKGVLDGMGMQSHVDAGHTTFSGTVNYLKAMDMFLALGIDVQVTELDISLDNGQSLQDQANKYKNIVQHICEVNTSGKYKGKVTLFQVWGPNDANTWISGDKSPTLYDKSNNPKIAYTTLMEYGKGLPDGGIEGFDAPAQPLEPDSNGYWFHHTFEDSNESWSGRGAASVETSGSQHYAGNKSLYVTGRESEWNGAIFTLNRAFEAGKEYSFSVDVMYTQGDDTRDFKLTLEYTDASGETTWDEIASGSAPTGEWLQLANTNYKIPSGASNCKIIVETTDGSLENFYMDEAIGAVAGTVIAGAGQPHVRTVILGDLTFDGEINVFDTAVARKYIVKEITDSKLKKAADVDRNGKFEAADLVLIHEYVLGKITEFPKATPVIDVAAMEAAFSGVTAASSYKSDNENYTLYTQRFGADPGWMVYDGRLYVFTTNDAFEYKNGQMQENSYDVWTINCISSADLVNWTDHGPIPAAGRRGATNGAASWANNSWAPDACWKKIDGKDKFFLYFADNGSGIGVLTADSPLGPWKDPIGKQLISRNTPNCGNVTWLFDPGVYYDEQTGKGYLAFGGGVPSGQQADPGTGRIVELGSDMISIVGTPTTLHPPYLFEDSSLIKIGDTWVYSFCHNWNVPGGQAFSNADIGYMTSSSPLGPYTYQGVVFKNTGSQRLDNGGNNHHSIVSFKNKYYVLYHTRRLEMNMGVNGGKGLNYRSPAINECSVNGTKLYCEGNMKGVAQLEKLDPYKKVEAETMSNQSKGIKVNGVGNTTVTLPKGEWAKVSGVDFGSGASSVTMRAGSSNGGVIKICSGSTNGGVIAYINVPAGSMTEIEAPVIDSVTGSKDIYLVASAEVEMDWWQFS